MMIIIYDCSVRLTVILPAEGQGVQGSGIESIISDAADISKVTNHEIAISYESFHRTVEKLYPPKVTACN